MRENRSQEVEKILSQYSNKQTGLKTALIGVHKAPGVEGNLGYTILEDLDNTSAEVQKLEQLGFKVIYPAELNEQEIERMSEEQKATYKHSLKTGLVVDTREDSHSYALSNIIASHFYSLGGNSLNGVDLKNNSTTYTTPLGLNKNAPSELNSILESVGFETSIDEYGDVKAKSDIPYPGVKKSKFEQIYNRAKGKIQEVFAKLKSLAHSKDQDKNNDIDERE